SGHGSGFFVSADGLILTNAHGVGTASRVRVTLSTGRRIYGEVMRRDTVRDVALVRVEPQRIRPLPLRFTPVKQAEKVYAIGTPTIEALSSTITSGIVSAVRAPESPDKGFIQADAPVSPGNSGGPLLDDQGNVVAITVLKVRGENLNLFIPIASALEAMRMKPAKTP
ncbi:MAG: serine protease, partial [Rhodospirillales bacterium]